MAKKRKIGIVATATAAVATTAMLVGATYAWFTDSVTSKDNIIQAGTLNVTLEHADSVSDVTNENWVDASSGAIFNYNKWEPGYTAVKYVKIENEGTLDFKFKLDIVPNKAAEKVNLADVIEVYMFKDAVEVSRSELKTDNAAYVGTLTSLINDLDGAAHGVLYADDEDRAGNVSEIYTIALKMSQDAGNEYMGTSVGGGFAVQLYAAQLASESDSLGDDYDGGALLPEYITADNIAQVDFTEEDKVFTLQGSFDELVIPKLGDRSVLDFNDAELGALKLGSDATVKGSAKIAKIDVTSPNASVSTYAAEDETKDVITMNIIDGNITIAGELGVRNTDGKSVLNIENSTVKFGTIFVGEHTNNERAALAEFNVKNSVLSGEENGMGSTINVWGRSGVKATIYDSEIYTYSRGWHQSEDANDNAITFQGANSIDVDMQRSNMHLYGARSIINARQYGSEETEINFTISECLIWTVTKSSHGDTTLPVWGATEIKDSILLFTKNVHQSTPAVFHSFVYGNPIIHGDYHVTTQCQWDADIVLADGQTVTFAKEANVSIYDGAGKVQFVKEGSAKVVLEEGAQVVNIDGLN